MTQQFHRKAGQLSRATWSKHLAWYVSMDIDNRGNITGLRAVCTYGTGEMSTSGTVRVKVGPFDDVDQVLEQLLVDSAVACHEQMTLFDRP